MKIPTGHKWDKQHQVSNPHKFPKPANTDHMEIQQKGWGNR